MLHQPARATLALIGGQNQRKTGEKHVEKQSFLQEDVGKCFCYRPGTQQPKDPSRQGMRLSPGVAFACPFPTPLGRNSVLFFPLPLVSALSTNNFIGVYQCIMLYY